MFYILKLNLLIDQAVGPESIDNFYLIRAIPAIYATVTALYLFLFMEVMSGIFNYYSKKFWYTIKRKILSAGKTVKHVPQELFITRGGNLNLILLRVLNDFPLSYADLL